MKNIIIGFCCAVIVGLGISAIQQSHETSALQKKVDSYVNGHKIASVELPNKMDFATEQVPLNHPDIYERMDREILVNTYWQSNTILLIKRASQFFPVIEPILKEEGIPDDFKYLAVIESGLQNVTSPAGAKGFWQFMPATAKEFDLEINSSVDERYHLEKATRAASKYLKQSYRKFGNWTLAAAAYNGGNGGINGRLDKQDVSSYYDMQLGDETGRYVFRIVALKYIMEQPEAFGFSINPKHLYKAVPVTAVTVNTEISNLSDFAKSKGINYKILKIHNPWLRDSSLTNDSKKEYQLAIPVAGYYE